jgi:hypothetical protein
MPNSRWGIYFIAIIFILLLIATLNYALPKRAEIIGHADGLLYFIYLRSIVIDHDLEFENDYQLIKFDYDIPRNTAGRAVNLMPPGMAILWVPLYLIAHLITLGLNALGWKIPLNGLSPPYIISVLISNWIYGLIGTIFCYKLCNRYFSPFDSMLATLSTFIASFMVYYLIFDPFFAHIGSFFAVMGFVYYWYTTREHRTYQHWLLLGLFAGLMAIIRWQNIIFVLLLGIDLLLALIKYLKNKNCIEFKKFFIAHLLFLVIFILVAVLPQLVVWKLTYGFFPLTPNDLIVLRGGSHYLLWNNPCFWEVLCSSRNGLFSWTPVAMLGLIGFFFFYKKDKWLTRYLLLTFLIMLYINSIVTDWWGGGGFGMRRFDGFIILFALGIATIISGLRYWLQKYPMAVIGLVLFGFIGWNFAIIRQFNNRQIIPGDTVSWKKVAAHQIDYTLRKCGYPFSYPANLLFSRKYHTSPENYDIVAGKYLDFWDYQLHSIIELYSIDPAFLNKGWSIPQKYGDIPVRWSDQPESSLFVTLRYPADYNVFIEVLPFAYPNAPTQIIAIQVNRKDVLSIPLETQWKEYMIYIPKNYWHQGVNEMRFKYAYTMAPYRVEQTNTDTRTLAVCWHYLKFKRLF